MRKLLTNIRAGDRIMGWAINCETCRLLFIRRRDALFCSNACQMVAHRERMRGKAEYEERGEASDNSFMGSLVGFNDD